MRIAVIGPVASDKYFGGVAIYTEGIADAFKQYNMEVKIITDYTNKKFTINGTEIIGIFKSPSRKSIKLILKLKEIIEEFEPDIIISSLEYGFVNRFLDSKVQTIHILHGFPSCKMPIFKRKSIEYFTRYISNNSNYVISNSSLTSIINSEIYDIQSNLFINIGLGYDFLENLKQCNYIESRDNDKTSTEIKHILYVGRLVKEKNVDKIIEAFSLLDKEKYILDIIGDGPELNNLLELANKLKINIKFHGRLNSNEIVKFYKMSSVFISLNPHEPYGIVYLEALANNVSIVCPSTGGQTDILSQYLDRVVFVKTFDSTEIKDSILKAQDLSFSKFSINDLMERFSYKKTVKEMLKLPCFRNINYN